MFKVGKVNNVGFLLETRRETEFETILEAYQEALRLQHVEEKSWIYYHVFEKRKNGFYRISPSYT